MKIDDKNTLINKISDINAGKIKKNNILQKTIKNDPDIKIKISSEGIKLSEYAQIVKNIESDRAGKIQNLKNSINDGTYKVNAEKIADKLIKDSLHEIIKDE